MAQIACKINRFTVFCKSFILLTFFSYGSIFFIIHEENIEKIVEEKTQKKGRW